VESDTVTKKVEETRDIREEKKKNSAYWRDKRNRRKSHERKSQADK
jgi:hypothetical protein